MGYQMWILDTEVEQWADRIRAEYVEMPGLALTKRQMRRLWRLDASICDAIVDSLIASKFLYQTHDQTYMRRHGQI